MRTYKPLLAALTLILALSSAKAQYHKYDTWDQNYTVQALLGAVQYEDLKFSPPDAAPDESTEIDVSLLPQLGGAWTTRPQEEERFQYGLEASFLLGFRFDKVNYAYLGGNGAYVSLSSSMWTFDLAGGAYANLFLTESENIRLYIAGGPNMIFASYSTERDYDDDSLNTSGSESAFGLGLYARTGIEFRVHRKGMLGLGVRGNWASLDFTEVGGSSDVDGIALFASYTAGF